jgi:hypothetical protein
MQPPVRIGNKNVLHSGLLVLDDEETAFIEIRLPLGAPITTDIVKIEFKCSADEPDGPLKFTWTTVGDAVKFVLTGLKLAGTGAVLPEAAHFGIQRGLPLFLQFVYSRIGHKNVVNLLVLQSEQQS